ncbi:MAG: 50S ribosomal protein L35 [Planctomycetota bacterium]
MPKMKTHKGLQKRVKVTANGKIKHKSGNAGHLMSGKSSNRCRSLRQGRTLNNPVVKKMVAALGGG